MGFPPHPCEWFSIVVYLLQFFGDLKRTKKKQSIHFFTIKQQTRIKHLK